MRIQLFPLPTPGELPARTLALPDEVSHWSLTTLREKLIKIGAKVVRHGRYVIFQLAEVAVSSELFAQIFGSYRSVSTLGATAATAGISKGELVLQMMVCQRSAKIRENEAKSHCYPSW